MTKSGKVGIGILGSQFVAEIHAESYRMIPHSELVAVASPSPGHAEAFSSKHGIPHAFTDYRRLLELPEVDLVDLCLPNSLHCQATVDAATAGKHIICEKPLCMNLAEADRMIAV